MDLLSSRVEPVCGNHKAPGDENIKNCRIHSQYLTMKPTGSLVNSNKTNPAHPRFSVHFDDGITILLHTISSELVYENMLSVGPETYFLKTGKWPKGKNLEKRINLAIEFIEKNIKNNRYKELRNKK